MQKSNLKPQPAAEGILLSRDYGDARQYTVTCECCSTDCTHQVWVEADDTGIAVTTYTKQKTKFWELNRFKIIWRLLTRGYVEYEASIIMTEQQAINYADILNKSTKDVAAFRKQRQSKK